MIGFVAWLGIVAILAAEGHLLEAAGWLIIPILIWLLIEKWR